MKHQKKDKGLKITFANTARQMYEDVVTNPLCTGEGYAFIAAWRKRDWERADALGIRQLRWNAPLDKWEYWE
jgi:hypothetical protein